VDKQTFANHFVEKMESFLGITPKEATVEDCYAVLAAIVKEQITHRWMRTNRNNREKKRKQVYYFSLEFMLGQYLEQNLLSLGLDKVTREVLPELGFEPDDIFKVELDPGLGNGGLGRLAACYMDSLTYLGLPGNGCSIRYKYGLFEQKIVDGIQVELPDNWLRNENVWETRKPHKAVSVKFYGKVREEDIYDADGVTLVRKTFVSEGHETVVAMPYDVSLLGSGNGNVNTLRLWSAESVNSMNFKAFSGGDYLNAVSEKYSAEAISEVLYPDDSNYQNRVLRLKQQYFFVSAGLQSIIAHYKKYYGNLHALPEYVSIHINDTHPALAIPELMRILMDEEGFTWEEAWELTKQTISYTNHTIMPEALEKWSVEVFSALMPRIYMIVHEINERWCVQLSQKFNFDSDRIARMAIEAFGEVRMAVLAVVGSHKTNGVAEVHSKLLRDELFKEFYEVLPERFTNVTNGVTQRRWLIKSNPGLSGAITDKLGTSWQGDMKQLQRLDTEGHLKDEEFLNRLNEIKLADKFKLTKIIQELTNVKVEPNAIFDVQVKRIHAYKRQHLNVLNILTIYEKLLSGELKNFTPRVHIFAGKAAPSYHFAKETIRLINHVADLINNDPRIDNLLKVVFLENYRVSLAERIFPASDISEQISTASKEASGTGNMKFMMNGALTIGTLDGANIEIFDAVGEENCVQFGLTVPEVLEVYKARTYRSHEYYENDARLKMLIDKYLNTSGLTSKAEFPNVYDQLITYNDEFLVLLDYAAYVEAHKRIAALYDDRLGWLEKSGMNIAYSGIFSSDVSIRNYAENIWRLK
jgi:starch phosphorylase